MNLWKSSVVALAALAVVTAPLAQAEPIEEAGPMHLRIASRLVNELNEQWAAGIFTVGGKALNSYGGGHNTTYIRLKSDGFEYAENYTQCSSFVTKILERAYGWDWKSQGATSTSPTAKQYCDLIKAGTGFQQIHNLFDVRPGDIISIDYSNDPSTTVTGHTMIVLGTLWRHSTTYDGKRVFHIRVIDSSSTPHANDSRVINGTKYTGAGVGTMAIQVDEQGAITGYFWSTIVNANNYKAPSVRELVIGRLVVPAAP